MKRLIIVRHAKSDWSDSSLPDFDRPLNDRGERDAPAMAKRLKEKRVVPDAMISSPAARAFATCLIFAERLGFGAEKITKVRDLYHANDEQILEVAKGVKDLSDKEEVVMLFGHNPGLTDFANQLISGNIDNIPTCGIVATELNIDRWADLEWGCGKLVFFDYPKSQH